MVDNKAVKPEMHEKLFDDMIHTTMIDRLRTNDHGEWEAFYHRCYAILVAFIHKGRFAEFALAHPKEKESIIAASIVAFFFILAKDDQKKLAFDNNHNKLSNYLGRILTNKCNDYFRDHKRFVPIEDQANVMEKDNEKINLIDRMSEPNAETLTDIDSDKAYYQVCLHQALQRTRKRVHKDSAFIFERCGLHGQSPDEVAINLNKKRSAVDEAKRKFQEILTREFTQILREHGEILGDNEPRHILKRTLHEARKNMTFFEATNTLAPEPNFLDRMEFVRQHLFMEPPPQPPGGYLLLISRAQDEGNLNQWRRLADNRVTIGKLPQSTICYPTKGVSGTHAELTRKQGSWTLADADSKNGTYVNGYRLLLTKPQRLTSGDIIQIVNHLLIFVTINDPYP